VFLASRSVWARARREVISLNAPPSSPISSRAPAGARAWKSPSPTAGDRRERHDRRTTTERMAIVRTAAAERIVRKRAIMS